VITGYNTDVEHDGVVYHVQTEDKGTSTPIILSLVYVGGAILASKRTRYDDLITAGYDDQILAGRLQRQHKLICAAIHAGRIEDLKRLSTNERDEQKDSSSRQAESSLTRDSSVDHHKNAVAPNDSHIQYPDSTAKNVPAAPSRAPEDSLRISLLEELDLRSGESVILRVRVKRANAAAAPVTNASIILKVLGTDFSPVVKSAVSDDEGMVAIPVELPLFKTGRAAILVRAESGGEIAELRRIIKPA
jgi:hypothetical protein